MRKRHRFAHWFFTSHELASWYQFSIKFHPSRWHIGVGLTLDYCVLNVGPLKLYIRWYGMVSRVFRLDELDKMRI